jgi:hypothetical protein
LIWLGCLICGAVAFGATPAAHAERFRGTTSQGRPASLTTHLDGSIKRLRFRRWHMSCDQPGLGYHGSISMVPPFDHSDPDRFFDRGTLVVRHRNKHDRLIVTATGRRVSDRRWKGTFRVSAKLVHRGHVYATCEMRKLSWQARAGRKGLKPPATVEMHSDEGDFIGQGGSYSYPGEGGRVQVLGNRELITASAGPWHLEFSAPEGRSLTPGEFADARRYPFNGSRAGLNVSGDGRGCDELTGEFRISASSFDAKGRLRSLRLSFEQHCEGAPPALTGSVVLRRR